MPPTELPGTLPAVYAPQHVMGAYAQSGSGETSGLLSTSSVLLPDDAMAVDYAQGERAMIATRDEATTVLFNLLLCTYLSG